MHALVPLDEITGRQKHTDTHIDTSVKGGDAKKRKTHSSVIALRLFSGRPRPVELIGNNQRATFWIHAKQTAESVGGRKRRRHFSSYKQLCGRDRGTHMSYYYGTKCVKRKKEKKWWAVWRGVFFFYYSWRNISLRKWMETRAKGGPPFLTSTPGRRGSQMKPSAPSFFYFLLLRNVCGETNAFNNQKPSFIIPKSIKRDETL